MTIRPKLYSRYLTIKISPELKERLRRASKEKGITYSEMVRRLVLNYLEGLGDAV